MDVTGGADAALAVPVTVASAVTAIVVVIVSGAYALFYCVEHVRQLCRTLRCGYSSLLTIQHVLTVVSTW